jgi:hypothetical protein
MPKSFWKEGKQFDWWLLIHFLGGLTTGMICQYFSLSFIPAMLIGCTVGFLWEQFERYKHIDETLMNQFFDYVFGGTGLITGYLLLTVTPDNIHLVTIFGIMLLGGSLAWHGYQGYKPLKRKRSNKKQP